MPTNKYYEPLKLFVIVSASIFIVEFFIMYYLFGLLQSSAFMTKIFEACCQGRGVCVFDKPFSRFVTGIIDASILILFIFPVIYFFSFRPMKSYISEVIRERELAQKTAERLQHTLEGTINALSQIAEFRDSYKQGIRGRISQLAVAIGREMGLAESQIDGIRIAGLFFDIGKIAVPGEILNKPQIKDENEFKLYKEYPKIGYNLLKDIQFPSPVARIILEHQERMDGSGYPQGLSGENILLEARILGVAYVIGDMVTPWSWQPAPGLDKALEEIVKNKGVLYDPNVVDACVKLFRDGKFEFKC